MHDVVNIGLQSMATTTFKQHNNDTDSGDINNTGNTQQAC
jgi:hypothetical protein